MQYEVINKYGAKGDGSTNDATALAAYFSDANTYGFPIVLPKKVFVCNTGLNGFNGALMESHGATIKTTSDSVVLLSFSAVNDWAIKGKLTLEGTRTAGGQSAAGGGLYISGCNEYEVEHLKVKKFKGAGIEIVAGTHVSPRGNQGQFNLISANDCRIGIKIGIGTGAEYNIFTNFSHSGCDKAHEVAGGNQIFAGGNVVDNTAGIDLTSGTNSAHGIYSATNINHNSSYNVNATDIPYGHTFSGCHIYGDSGSAGKIILTNCSGIQFVGGTIDATIENVTAGVNFAIGNFDAGSLFSVTGNSASSFKLAYNCDTSGLRDEASVGTVGDGAITFAKLASGIIASQAEAEAGTATDKLLTPLRCAEAIAAIATGGGGGTFTLLTGGTNIGSMTGNGGLTAGFDGTTSKIWDNCAREPSSGNTGYIGKNWGSNKTVTKYEVWGSSDYGLDSTPSANTITLTLQGSTDNFSGSIVDLHTNSFSDANAISKSYSSGITTTTAYQYHRVKISMPSGGPAVCAQVKFYETV